MAYFMGDKGGLCSQPQEHHDKEGPTVLSSEKLRRQGSPPTVTQPPGRDWTGERTREETQIQDLTNVSGLNDRKQKVKGPLV